MKRLVFLCFGLLFLLVQCEGGMVPGPHAGKVAWPPDMVTLNNVVTGSPAISGGQNEMAISWPVGQREQAIRIDWNDVENASSYKVYRSTAENGTAELIGTVDAPISEYADSNVDSGITYYYHITSIVNDVESLKSSIITGGIGTTVNNTVVGFNVYRSRELDGNYYRINPEVITGSTFYDKDLPSGKTFYYMVTAVFLNSLETNTGNTCPSNELPFQAKSPGTTNPPNPTAIYTSIRPCLFDETSTHVKFFVNVYDQADDFVPGLGSSNFAVTIDGNPVGITSATKAPNGGHHIGAVNMDYSGSMLPTDIALMENALASGLVTQKGAMDTFEIIKFDHRVSVESAFTNNLTTLLAAINNGAIFGGNTALYDAMGTAIVDAYNESIPSSMANIYHKRYIISWSDGENNSSTLTQSYVIGDAQTKCVPVFAVGYDGTWGSVGINELVGVTDATGGVTMLANNSSTGLFEKIAALIDGGYIVHVSKPAGALSGISRTRS